MSKNPKDYDKKYRNLKEINRIRKEREKRNAHNKARTFDQPDEI